MPRAEVLPLLATALARCEHLEVVIYERRGVLGSAAARATYRDDFLAVRGAVEQAFASEATNEATNEARNEEHAASRRAGLTIFVRHRTSKTGKVAIRWGVNQ